MAGPWLGEGSKYWRKVKKQENHPYRTAPRGGRKGCWGRSGDPVPGQYNPKNCQGKLHQQRYSED